MLCDVVVVLWIWEVKSFCLIVCVGEGGGGGGGEGGEEEQEGGGWGGSGGARRWVAGRRVGGGDYSRPLCFEGMPAE